MLRLIVPGDEAYDESTSEFVTVGDIILDLEHSLVSVSKWESKYKKPFLSEAKKTTEETLDYIKLMVLTSDFPPEVFSRLTPDNLTEVNNYIQDPMTATWFNEMKKAPKTSETITSELIYFWLSTFSIPFEPVERWHLNRLLTLVKICSIKNSKPEKVDKATAAERRRELNERRRKEFNTRG